MVSEGFCELYWRDMLSMRLRAWGDFLLFLLCCLSLILSGLAFYQYYLSSVVYVFSFSASLHFAARQLFILHNYMPSSWTNLLVV